MPEQLSTRELIEKAREAESVHLEDAANIYHDVLDRGNLSEEAYDRLMIVYRKLKDYKNELVVIDRGIKAYEDFYKAKSSRSKKVAELSNKLAKSTGLLDKKGNTTYDPEPIAKWKKRRLLVEKRLKPKKK
jgi:hypothetical protein